MHDLIYIRYFGCILWSVNAFDRGSDSPGGDRPAEAAATDGPVKAAAFYALVETRSRSEASADLKQAVESGWDRHRVFEAPRAELARFRLDRAKLAEVSAGEADRYVEQHRTDRPWLTMADRATPEARRIIAALDQGGGHGHIRHEGWVTEDANLRRAAYLEDPAQLDEVKRLRGIDGLKPNDKKHICGRFSTRITDPDAFATAFARGVERPEVQRALKRTYNPEERPDPVRLPIAALLGADGHKLCTGWQLEPVAGSMNAAINNRKEWRAALAEGRQPNAPKPAVRPVASFEDGALVFVFGHNQARDGYEVVSLYSQPRI